MLGVLCVRALLHYVNLLVLTSISLSSPSIYFPHSGFVIPVLMEMDMGGANKDAVQVPDVLLINQLCHWLLGCWQLVMVHN